MFKRLFYTLNSDKQFSRQVQALNYLASVHTTVSINELAQQIGCSVPTLRTDIRELNDLLPAQIHVESLGKNGYFLSFPSSVSIPSVIMDLARDTDVFKIIDGIFHGELLSLDELSYKLFLAPFTLKKVLHQIQDTLVHFNLSLTTNPVNIQGDETDIRFFFFSFYSDFNDLSIIDPDYLNHATTYQHLMNCVTHYNDQHLHLNYFGATSWLIILKERLKYLHPVNQHEVRIEPGSQANYHAFREQLRKRFSFQFGIQEISENEIIWIYTIMLACVSYSEPTRLFNQDSLESNIFHREQNTQLVRRIDDFLSLQFESDIMNSDLIEPMRSYLLNLDPLSMLSSRLQRLSVSTRNFTKESINNYYITWLMHLESEVGQSLLDIEYKDDVAVTLAMLHFSLLTHLRTHELRILFTYQGEPGYDDFLIRTTQFMIPQNVRPIYVFDQPITPELLAHSEIDFVVSNYDLPFRRSIETPVFRLSYIPNLAEWTHLRNVILELSLASHDYS